MNGRRVCILTGAGGTLGSDFCARYADKYDIVAVCRRRVPQIDTQDTTYFDPIGPVATAQPAAVVHTVIVDLEEEGAAKRIVEIALARHGRIDLIVNAAAHVEHERLAASAESSASLERAFYVNATFPVILASVAAREFWFGRRAENLASNRNIINVSSGAGLGYVYSPGLAAYSASKGAMNFLTCYLAEEFQGFGIRVNAIAPTTFPELIPTELVSDRIVELDGGTESGSIIELS